ncbi:tetratricopeptide repeat protein [Sulfuracidifex tepidarius]|uniref:tetratricopeptide repeat protein n=1 Tax=Sulfuracidifex tepidarius TaxID=1294262 RepID=UPI0006D29B40|nr:hypothetical protein [Sulfuracidifex tepidarius]
MSPFIKLEPPPLVEEDNEIARRINEILQEFHTGLAYGEKVSVNLNLLIQECDEVMTFETEKAYPHYVKAFALAMEEAYTDALRECDEAINLDPQNAYPHYVKAVIFYLMDFKKFKKEAISECRTAVNLERENALFHFTLAEMYSHGSSKREILNALTEYVNATNLDPGNLHYHLKRAEYLEKQGLIDRAIEEYKVMINLNPRDLNFQSRLRSS